MDGRAVAARVRERVAEGVRALKQQGTVPRLSVVLVGDDPASAAYVRSKAKCSDELGMHGETIRKPATMSSSTATSPSGFTARTCASHVLLTARNRASSEPRVVRVPQSRQTTRARLPCSSRTPGDPAAV